MCRIGHIVNDVITDRPGSIVARKIFQDTAPVVRYSFMFDLSEVRKDPNYYHWDVAVDEADAALVGFEAVEGQELVPSAMCIYTIFVVHHHEHIRWNDMEHIEKQIHGNGMKISGKVYGNNIIETFEEDGSICRWFEAWITVE